jgi:hypothetical protein
MESKKDKEIKCKKKKKNRDQNEMKLLEAKQYKKKMIKFMCYK